MWMMVIPVGVCLYAVYWDVREREIPDPISACLLVTGFMATGLSWHPVNWLGAILGVVLAFVLTLPFTLLDGIGGGDLKVLSGLGAWLGPTLVLSLLFWTAIAGVVSAVVAHFRHQKDFAYAPGIAAALVVTVVFPSGLPTAIEAIRNALPLG